MPYTIIYIAGAGRSGSTMLDIVLGNHAQIVSTGEVSYLINQWGDLNPRCACTRHYTECEFWNDLFAGPPDPQLARLIRYVEHVSFLPHLLAGRVAPDVRERYREYHEQLFAYITARAGKPIIVDSSKTFPSTAGRFLALSRLAGHRVYVVHLIRNGLATMESRLGAAAIRASRGERAATRAIATRVAVSWVRSNVLASVLGRLVGPAGYLQLRYEDFLAEPAAGLRRIGQMCGFDPAELIDRVQRDDVFPVGHLARGNRVRLQSAIRIQRGKRPGAQRLEPHQRLIFAAVGGWLHLLYGYGWSTAATSKAS